MAVVLTTARKSLSVAHANGDQLAKVRAADIGRELAALESEVVMLTDAEEEANRLMQETRATLPSLHNVEQLIRAGISGDNLVVASRALDKAMKTVRQCNDNLAQCVRELEAHNPQQMGHAVTVTCRQFSEGQPIVNAAVAAGIAPRPFPFGHGVAPASVEALEACASRLVRDIVAAATRACANLKAKPSDHGE